MADPTTADASSPSLNLSAEEKRVYGQLFRQADSENIGVVTGEAAVKFFEKTRLDARVLGEIWQIADKENRGLLTPAGFGIVLRLIGHYQAGREPSPELAFQSGPLPKFDGGPPGGPIQPAPPTTAPSLQPQTSGSGAPIRVPPLTPDKVAQYSQLFEKSGAQNGVLPGDQAKQIFERAGLPNEVLGRIWNLADTEERGALQTTEFIIAMHLLASYKSGAMRALPNILPAGLYEAAARRGPPRQVPSIPPPPISSIPRQFSGQPRVLSPLGRSAYGPPIAPQMTGHLTGQMTGQSGGDWAITPQDKQRFDQIYVTLDTSNKGFITGEEAVPFFSNSKLPEEALAQIWDLADINSKGSLTKDEFCVAMYLIRQQRSKRDGRDNLPATLPANLIPPSMRNQSVAPAQPTAPAFVPEQPVAPIPKSAADDLFGLDALSSSPPPAPQPQVAVSTGGSTSFGDPFGNNRSPMTPSSPMSSSQQLPNTFKPFVPSSSFGRSLEPQATGGSNTSLPSQARPIQTQHTGMDDLLGDNDPEVSKKFTNETTELANLSNQVGTLSKQMQDVQSQRGTTQTQVAAASTQKREFEARLAQLRALYEQEVKEVSGLKEKLSASINETQNLKQELATVEASLQELQAQRGQIFAQLQSDQQENATLKERMRTVNAEVQQLEPQLEKLRSEARQQKGLVAINKKQLATNEMEREKLKTESDELTISNEENARAIAEASRVHSPPAVQVASPAPSAKSASNPFFRSQTNAPDGATYSPIFPSSPVVAHDVAHSFDDVFGSSFTPDPAVTASMPPTSFKTEAKAHHDVPVAAKSVELPRAVSDQDNRVATPELTNSTVTSRDFSGLSQPPAVPESRQISSSFLPFPHGSALDSVSSSRQVSAPNSRFGDVAEDSTGANTPTNYDATTPTGSSSAGNQTETAIASSAAEPSRNVDSAPESIPGAFPGDENSQIVGTPLVPTSPIESKMAAINHQGPIDPFGFDKVESKAPAAATKDDFDSAFAGFGTPSKPIEREEPPANGASKVNQEFPPLQQIEDDDESDSDEGGFDDDFDAGSGGHFRNESTTLGATSQPPMASDVSPVGGLNVPRPALPTNDSALTLGEDPPTPEAQNSPPIYGSVASPKDATQAEADSYAGLLPTREDPTSNSPVEAISGPSATVGQHVFASAAPIVAEPSKAPAPPAKVPFDDNFDDEFDDLEDAKEGGDDDDFANLSINDRSDINDFNPTFDSPTTSKTSGHHTMGSNGFGESTHAFGDLVSSPSRTAISDAVPKSASGPSSVPATDNHDWDAIFSGLDSAPPQVLTNPSLPFGDEIKPSPTVAASNGAGSSSTAAPPRPEIGRALTEAGVHDDPILKELTEMGYARKDALTALEKYDYNLERAANYLASTS